MNYTATGKLKDVSFQLIFNVKSVICFATLNSLSSLFSSKNERQRLRDYDDRKR